MTGKTTLLLACGLALAMPAQAQRSVTLSEVKSATTVEEFLALGATQLTEAQFRANVVGRLLDEGGWTWVINADGTHASSADDGSWSDQGGHWEFRDGRYCRGGAEETEMTCSRAFLIGSYLRMEAEPGQLSGWTVQID